MIQNWPRPYKKTLVLISRLKLIETLNGYTVSLGELSNEMVSELLVELGVKDDDMNFEVDLSKSENLKMIV